MHRLRQSRLEAEADRDETSDPAPPSDARSGRDPAVRSSRSLLAKVLHSFQNADDVGDTSGVSDLKAIGDLLSRKMKSSRWPAK